MIKINQTPYPTSKNYGINDIEIDEKIFEVNSPNFFGFQTKNDSEIKFFDDFSKNNQIQSGFLDQNIEKNCNFQNV